MPFWGVPINPVEETVDPITCVIRIFHWFHIHVNSRCKIMDFRNPVDVILRRITSHFHVIIKVWMHDSHPNHCVFDSFQMREVSDIDVDNCRRFIERHFVGTSFKLMFIVEKIDSCPSECLKLLRLGRVEEITEIILWTNFCNSSRICS